LAMDWLGRFPRARAALATLIILGNALPLAATLPYPRHEMRPVLEGVSANVVAGDHVYVYYGARHAYEWYAPQVGLDDVPTTKGICARNSLSAYVDDLQRLPASSRVWVVMSHAMPDERRVI